MLGKNIAVRQSAINAMGVFAIKDFRKGEGVVPWKNTRELTPAEYAALPSIERNYIEMKDGKILLVGIPERYVNHSCDPNTLPDGLCDRAARDIKAGEEITSDYSQFFIPNGSFTCTCGNPGCRGIITGKNSEAAQ